VLVFLVLAITVIFCWAVVGLKSDLQKINFKILWCYLSALCRLDFSPSGFMALWPMAGISAYFLGFSHHGNCLLAGWLTD
jgi:hypothetical protein